MLFLSMWLVALSAWPQSGSPGATMVDSREECAALGGAWLANRGTWQAACQVPWGRPDCLRLGGAWTPMAAAPGGGVCVAQVSQRATARQCTASGGAWGPPGSPMPYCQPAAAAAKAPVKAASDANKRCDSQRDCTYGCVYQGPVVPSGADVLGRCRATPVAKGCFSMVESGRLAGEVCVD